MADPTEEFREVLGDIRIKLGKIESDLAQALSLMPLVRALELKLATYEGGARGAIWVAGLVGGFFGSVASGVAVYLLTHH